MLAIAYAAGTLTGANAVFWAAVLALTVIFFLLAVTRQTLLAALFSCLSWFALGYSTLACFGSVVMLHVSFFLFCILCGVIMLFITFKFTFDFLEANLKEKQRRISEEII